MLIRVEFSPNSRATCAACKEKILKGTRRLWGNLGSGNFGYYYHLGCFVNQEKPELDKIFYYMYLIQKMYPNYGALLSVLEEPASSSEHPPGNYQVANLSGDSSTLRAWVPSVREEDNEM